MDFTLFSPFWYFITEVKARLWLIAVTFELQVCPLLFPIIVLNDIILVSESVISNTTRVALLRGKVLCDGCNYWARLTACLSRQHFSLQMETWFPIPDAVTPVM